MRRSFRSGLQHIEVCHTPMTEKQACTDGGRGVSGVAARGSPVFEVETRSAGQAGWRETRPPARAVRGGRTAPARRRERAKGLPRRMVQSCESRERGRRRPGWGRAPVLSALAVLSGLAGCAGAPHLGDPPDRQEILDRGLPRRPGRPGHGPARHRATPLPRPRRAGRSGARAASGARADPFRSRGMAAGVLRVRAGGSPEPGSPRTCCWRPASGSPRAQLFGGRAVNGDEDRGVRRRLGRGRGDARARPPGRRRSQPAPSGDGSGVGAHGRRPGSRG